MSSTWPDVVSAAMKPSIRFVKEWSDEHVVELRIAICDGTSLFVNRIYAGHDQLRNTVAGLRGFARQIEDGMFDLRFGEFGPEYASGAFEARLRFRKHGKILARVRAQSEFNVFEDENLASAATLNLMSEPALLDEFIRALHALSEGTSPEAELEAIRWH